MTEKEMLQYLRMPPEVKNMAQADQWGRFKVFTWHWEQTWAVMKKIRTMVVERMDQFDARLDRLERSKDGGTPEAQGQGVALANPAGTAQTNAKRRSLETKAKYQPEMTYDEIFAARDARWSKGQGYRNTKELSLAFPKSLMPQQAFDAAARERYWMYKNGAIEWDGVRYTLCQQWVDRFVE